jgi:hypothetical protein
MGVSGQLHALAALPPGKESPEPFDQEAGWFPEPVWTFWRTESSLALAGNGTLYCPPCSLVTRLTTLSWLTRLNLSALDLISILSVILYSVFHKSIRDLEAWPCSSKPTYKR